MNLLAATQLLLLQLLLVNARSQSSESCSEIQWHSSKSGSIKINIDNPISNHSANMKCSWLLTPPVTHSLTAVSVSSVQLAEGGCLQMLQLLPTETSVLSLCNGLHSSRSLTLNSKKLLIAFISSNRFSHAAGFQLNFTFTATASDASSTRCDSETEVEAEQGEIRSHPAAGFLPIDNHLRCEWRITGPVGSVIKVNVMYISLGSYFDALVLFDGDRTSGSQKIAILNSNTSMSFSSTGRSMTVRFESGERLQGLGFRLRFVAVQPNELCGKLTHISNHSGILNSHIATIPASHPGPFACSWNIPAKQGYYLMLMLVGEENRHLGDGILTVSDGNANGSVVLLQTSDHVINAGWNAVLNKSASVQFSSSSSGFGFQFGFAYFLKEKQESVCPPITWFSNNNGAILIYNKIINLNQVKNMEHCSWYLQPPAGHAVTMKMRRNWMTSRDCLQVMHQPQNVLMASYCHGNSNGSLPTKYLGNVSVTFFTELETEFATSGFLLTFTFTPPSRSKRRCPFAFSEVFGSAGVVSSHDGAGFLQLDDDYRYRYRSDDCQWQISVPAGMFIRASFLLNTMSADQVTLHDGKNRRRSRQIFPIRFEDNDVFYSTGSFMTVILRSHYHCHHPYDYYHYYYRHLNGFGFRLQYRAMSYHGRCSVTDLSESSRQFTMQSHPSAGSGSYARNQMCEWRIPRFRDSSMSLALRVDLLKLLPHDCVTILNASTAVHRLCGNTNFSRVLHLNRSFTHVRVRFHAEASDQPQPQATGFRIHAFRVADCNSIGETLTGRTGSIVSQPAASPTTYNSDMYFCSWTVQVQRGQHISLRPRMEWYHPCANRFPAYFNRRKSLGNNDCIIIEELDDSGNVRNGSTICGNSYVKYDANKKLSDRVKLTLIGEASELSGAVIADYFVTDGSSCGGHHKLNDVSGRIYSHKMYGIARYPKGIRCSWRIPGRTGYRILIAMNYHDHLGHSDDCLTISTETGSTVKKICSTVTSDELTTITDGAVVLNLRTGGKHSFRGFQLDYVYFRGSTCGQLQWRDNNETIGAIQSHVGYPYVRFFTENHNCIWHIPASHGQLIRLTAETDSHSYGDTMHVTISDAITNQIYFNSFSTSDISNMRVMSQSSLKIELKSSRNYYMPIGAEFSILRQEIQYCSSMGETLTSDAGSIMIHPAASQNAYNSNMMYFCSWTVTAQPGQLISIRPRNLQLNHGECLEIEEVTEAGEITNTTTSCRSNGIRITNVIVSERARINLVSDSSRRSSDVVADYSVHDDLSEAILHESNNFGYVTVHLGSGKSNFLHFSANKNRKWKLSYRTGLWLSFRLRRVHLWPDDCVQISAMRNDATQNKFCGKNSAIESSSPYRYQLTDQMQQFYAPGVEANLQFSSNTANHGVAFELEFIYFVDDFCGKLTRSSKAKAEIHSHIGFGHISYFSNMNCRWHVPATAEPYEMQIVGLELADSDDCLGIFTGNNTEPVWQTCGELSYLYFYPNIFSFGFGSSQAASIRVNPGEELLIIFKSDAGTRMQGGRGFKILLSGLVADASAPVKSNATRTIETPTTATPATPVHPACARAPCFNGGVCSVDNERAFCICAPGFEGQICQINTNDCTQNPCNNGGTCIDRVNGFACACTDTWTGSNCSVDRCAELNCGQNANCIHDDGSVRCSCNNGFYLVNQSCVSDTILSTENATQLPQTCFQTGSGLCNIQLPVSQPVLVKTATRMSVQVALNGYVTLENRAQPHKWMTRNPRSALVVPLGLSLSSVSLNREHTRISYEIVSRNSSVNWRSACEIVTDFSGEYFAASEILIVTWRKLEITGWNGGEYRSLCHRFCKRVSWCSSEQCVYCRYCHFDHVSFQLVMARNGSHSYSIFNFGQSQLQLTSRLLVVSGLTDGRGDADWLSFSWSRLSQLQMPNLAAGNVARRGRFVTVAATEVAPSDAAVCSDWLSTLTRIRCNNCPTNHLQAVSNLQYSLYSLSCDPVHKNLVTVCYIGLAQCGDGRPFCTKSIRPRCCYRVELRGSSRMEERYLRSACDGGYSRTVAGRYLARLWIGGPKLEHFSAGAAPVLLVGNRWKSGFPIDNEADKVYICLRAQMYSLLSFYRPVCTSAGYAPVVFSSTRGDPHFTTLDNKEFTFNGHGEYVMLMNATAEMDSLQLQARTDVAQVENTNRSSKATVLTAIALQTGSNSVAVLLDRDANDLRLFSDSGHLGIARDELARNESFSFGDVTVTASNHSVLVIDSLSGVALNVSLSVNFLEFRLQLPAELKGKVRGLLGNFNGNESDDFELRNGSKLSPDASERQIFDFGNSWRLLSSDPLILPYPAGTERSNFTDINFVPVFVTDFRNRIHELFTNNTLMLMSNSTCWNNKEQEYVSCMYDAAMTESVAAAEAATRNAAEEAALTVALTNSPPQFAMPANITVTAASNFSIDVTVSDPDSDNVTLSVSGSGIDISGSLSLSGAALQWRVGDNFSDNVSISVLATDARGAQSQWSPVILLCDCERGAECDFSHAAADRNAGSSWYVGVCQCPSGYQGNRCQISACDVDPPPCFGNGSCSVSSNGSFSCGACPRGMVGDGVMCETANPCLSNSGCEQLCNPNSSSSSGFTCSCGPGFRVSAANSSRCDDVNECITDLHSCKAEQNQTCSNNIGSFSCSCPSGQRLNALRDCEIIHRCSRNSCAEQRICVALSLGFDCVCGLGFSDVNGVCVSDFRSSNAAASGAAAIIIISVCAAAGAAFICVAVFIFCRRRRQQQNLKSKKRNNGLRECSSTSQHENLPLRDVTK